MNIRKTIDRIMSFLLIILAIGILFYYSTVVFVSKALLNDEISEKLSDFLGSEIEDIDISKSERVEKNGNDPIVKLLLSSDGKLDSLLEATKISSSNIKTKAVMYNPKLDYAFLSLDSYVIATSLSSSITTRIVLSNEYKNSFPAEVTTINYYGHNYTIYSAGCKAENIPTFLKKYGLSYDQKLLGMIFRIEKEKDANSDNNERYSLSTNYMITIQHNYSLEYDMPDFNLEYFITQK